MGVDGCPRRVQGVKEFISDLRKFVGALVGEIENLGRSSLNMKIDGQFPPFWSSSLLGKKQIIKTDNYFVGFRGY